MNVFNPRVFKYANREIQNLIKEINKIEYTLIDTSFTVTASEHQIFTIAITVHDVDIDFYIQSVNSILNQTYSYVELIIIEHGTNINIKKYNRNLLNSKCNIKIMEISQNNESNYFNLINAAVFHSIGRYFFFLAYDDYLSVNYAEEMIRLFENNDKCVTVAPLPVSVDRFGNNNILTSRKFFQNNKRNTYTNGCELALSFINNDGAVSAPGGLFAFKTEIIIEKGGLDEWNDISQFIKFGIYGDSGYSNSSKLYWRHHDKQTNKKWSADGKIYYQSFIAYYETSHLFYYHQILMGIEFANQVKKYVYQSAEFGVTSTIVRFIEKGRLTDLFKYYTRAIKIIPVVVICRSSFQAVSIMLRKIFKKIQNIW